ncbi:MAG: BREX system Lon protease-like protein BrxL, partial [Candidatus Gastranaerophilaceae bacterium]
MNDLDKKITEVFEGYVVRKDLVKELKGSAVVPSYVLEYLLGQYCATNDEDAINQGIESVKTIIQKHYVQRNEAELVKSNIRAKGYYKVIDKIQAKLDEKVDCHKATFSNLGISNVVIDEDTVNRKHPRLLVSGVWCLADLEYQYSEDKNVVPWVLQSVKPIQLSQFDFEDFIAKREQFTTDEWIDLTLQSIGFNPEMLSRRNKFLQLVRLIPFCERNYNLVELGPKGTGKSHIYTEFSPHGTLISGGEVTAAKLFVNNARRGNIGLVGYWDNIAFDEFAGSTKKADKALVDIMKGYMANQSFSRGVETLNAEASMTFIGNTKHNVPYMLKNSNLFEELPSQYLDSAFLDRLHFYIPGWEIDVIRNELFSDGYGFVVDYYAEALKTLRSYDYSNEYKQAVELSSDISTRDRDGIRKTFSGLMKIIYPHKKATNEEIEEILKFAMEGRKRVKDQILRIDATLPAVDFSYTKKSGEKVKIKTLEEIQYKNLYYQGRYSDDDIEGTITNTTLDVVKQKTMQISENNIHKESDLKEQHIEIEENQTGITYEKLFGDYIKNANKIVITDPYIRNFYQTLNLMELIELIEQKKSEADVVEVELITSRDEFNSIQQEENLATIRESCFQLGIEFSYSFDETIHARSIVLDNGWKISLDRGLDIYQNCERNDVFQFTTRVQKYRP